MKRSLLPQGGSPSSKKSKMSCSYAFVSLLYGSQPFYLEYLVLARSLRSLQQYADIILLIGEDVSEDILQAIACFSFIQTIRVNTPEVHPSHIGATNRWIKAVFNKCHIWGLTEYKKVMFLDADIVVHRPDELLKLFEDFVDVTVPAACIMGENLLKHNKLVHLHQTNPEKSKVIAGLMIISPSAGILQRMFETLRSPSILQGKYFTNHEEVFLGVFFPEWYSIHAKYQFIPLSVIADQTVQQYYLQLDYAVATHFCGWKPHAYIKNQDYAVKDKQKYRKFVSHTVYHIMRTGIDDWLEHAQEVRGTIEEKLGKDVLSIGDWKTKVNYTIHSYKEKT